MAPEMPPVNFVHGGEVIHVRKKYSGSHNAFERGTRGFENAPNVFEDARGLFGDTPLDHLLIGRIERDLAGKKYQSICPNRLRIRPDRFGPAIGCNHFFHMSLPEE